MLIGTYNKREFPTAWFALSAGAVEYTDSTSTEG